MTDNIQGLQNTGATCYFNSLMQALISCNIPNRSPLITAINNVYETGINTVNVALKTPMPPGQQCPLELLDRIAETCTAFESFIRIRYEETTICCGCRRRIEHGEQAHDGPREVYTHHNITNGNMFLEKPVKAAMMRYVQNVTFACKCGAVNSLRDHRLRRLNDILIIQYPHTGQYIMSLLHAGYINMEDARKLRGILSGSRPIPPALTFDGKGHTRRYQLCAMIKHVGATPQSGHYWCVCRRGNDWYRANDSHVSPTKYSAELTDVIVAFYRLT